MKMIARARDTPDPGVSIVLKGCDIIPGVAFIILS
jgi:hypothetical protein